MPSENMMSFFSGIDEKLGEVGKKNLSKLSKIATQMRTFKVNVFGEEFTAYMPPYSVEQQMIEELTSKNGLSVIDYAKKYLPMWYGFPEQEVEKMSLLQITEFIKAYLEEYNKVVGGKFRVNPNGKKQGHGGNISGE